MGYSSLASAALALGAILVPGTGKYLAVGLGILALGFGVVGWRSPGPRATPRGRLSAAAGVALALVALVLGGAKIGLTLLAMGRLEQLF